MSARPAVTRTPVTIVSRDPSAFKDTYGGAVGLVATGATLIGVGCRARATSSI